MDPSRARVHQHVSFVPVGCIAQVALVRMNVLRDSIQFKTAPHAYPAHRERSAQPDRQFQGNVLQGSNAQPQGAYL